MTWIKLHSYGKEYWCDFSSRIQLQHIPGGPTWASSIGKEPYDETPEQIIALIAEAERGDRESQTVDVAEPPDLTDEEADRLYNEAAAKARPFSSEQIDRMIAATVKREWPKIDARKIEELCDDLQAQSGMFGAYSIQYPSLKASIEQRIEEIRAAIRKELGL